MKIVLIRHGETFSNTLYGTPEQILIGALDSDITLLNENGRLQAMKARTELVNEQLIVDEIYTSDLQRTIQTTEIIFPNREYIKDKRLRERSLGILEGMRINVVNEDEDLVKCLPDSSLDDELFFTLKHSTAENYIEVYERCSDFLKQFDYTSNKTIAVVSHFHTIRCFLYAMFNKKFDHKFHDLIINNSTPYIFEYSNGNFRLISSNLNLEDFEI